MRSPQITKDRLYLSDIAHARSGDKGNHANMGVIAWTDEGFAFLEDFLTSDFMARYFEPLHPERVERFCLPGIRAYNFVLYNVLAGGASGSLRTDSQGKALASALLRLTLRKPDGWQQMLRSRE